MEDVVIVCPTKRPPPIKTFENYPVPDDLKVFVIADPEVYGMHAEFYECDDQFCIFTGARGLGPQLTLAYSVPYGHGFEWFFKIDDDLAAETFIHKEDYFPDLQEVIEECFLAADQLGVSLVGVANSANRYWLGEKVSRTYGLIHGGANLAATTNHPEQFIDRRIRKYGDVYRSLSHRVADGAVGRVGFIGFDKSKSTEVAGGSSVRATQEEIDESKRIILERFAGMVTCEGSREIQGGFQIANWRFKRGHCFVK